MDPTDPVLLDEEIIPEAGQTAPDKKEASQAYALGRSGGYNLLKSFHGQYYSGMAVSGSNAWNYDSGVWHEVKEEPDLWKINYKTNKKRAKKAPERSGAPAGTEYHWFIVAHQYVRKTDANTYETNPDAKRRIQGLPPVLSSEKVKVKSIEKGQQKLEDMLSKGSVSEGSKRKRGQ